jgi:hypothetical protein
MRLDFSLKSSHPSNVMMKILPCRSALNCSLMMKMDMVVCVLPEAMTRCRCFLVRSQCCPGQNLSWSPEVFGIPINTSFTIETMPATHERLSYIRAVTQTTPQHTEHTIPFQTSITVYYCSHNPLLHSLISDRYALK